MNWMRPFKNSLPIALKVSHRVAPDDFSVDVCFAHRLYEETVGPVARKKLDVRYSHLQRRRVLPAVLRLVDANLSMPQVGLFLFQGQDHSNYSGECMVFRFPSSNHLFVF